MELRAEPRFNVNASAKVIPFDARQDEIPSSLLNISATGIRVLVDRAFAPGQILLIELEDHLVMAEARYCECRGDKYAVGLRRVHDVEKSGVPESREGRVAAVIESLEQRVSVQDDAYLEEVLARVLGKPAPVPRLELVPPPEPVAAITPPQALPAEAPSPEPQAPVAESQPEPIVHHPVADHVDRQEVTAPEALSAEVRLPSPEASVPEEPSDPVPSQTQADDAVRPPAPSHKTDLRELPVVTAAIAAAHEQPKTRQRSWKMAMTIAASFAVAMTIGYASLHKRSTAVAQPTQIATVPSAPVQPAQVAVVPPVPAQPEPAAPPPQAAAIPEPRPNHVATPPKQTGKHHIQLEITKPNWISASVDGTRVFAKMFQGGDRPELDFAQEALIHVGNAEGVELILDGKSQGALANHQTLKFISVRKDGVHPLPWSNDDPGTK